MGSGDEGVGGVEVDWPGARVDASGAVRVSAGPGELVGRATVAPSQAAARAIRARAANVNIPRTAEGYGWREGGAVAVRPQSLRVWSLQRSRKPAVLPD